MTAQFHEGQEVEVRVGAYVGPSGWHKAKIVSPYAIPDGLPRGQLNEKFFVEVQFRDGSRAVVGAEHIRGIEDPLETAARYLNQGGTIEGERS